MGSSHFRRRNSIATSLLIPDKLTFHTSSLPNANSTLLPLSLDLELVSLKSSESYTSLKDLLPSSCSSVNSPSASTPASSVYEISIRNRLVKHAAWAYLQPMSSSPDSSSSPNIFLHLWRRLFDCHVFLGFARAFDCFLIQVNT